MPPDNTYQNELAIRLRIARGPMKIEKVAAALGVSTDQYKKWEAGEEPMPARHLPTFCRVTKASPTFVTCGTTDEDWSTETGTVDTGVFAKSGRYQPDHPVYALQETAWSLANLISGIPIDYPLDPDAAASIQAALEYISAAEQYITRLVED